MIQHDMMMFDHGMPGPDGKVSPEQRPRSRRQHRVPERARSWPPSRRSSRGWSRRANEKYATDYPAAVGPHMTNTDSTPFMDLVPSISLRENERGAQIGGGWDPHWHQPTDVYRDVQRRGLPPRAERGADDARRGRGAGGGDAQEVTLFAVTLPSCSRRLRRACGLRPLRRHDETTTRRKCNGHGQTLGYFLSAPLVRAAGHVSTALLRAAGARAAPTAVAIRRSDSQGFVVVVVSSCRRLVVRPEGR